MRSNSDNDQDGESKNILSLSSGILNTVLIFSIIEL